MSPPLLRNCRKNILMPTTGKAWPSLVGGFAALALLIGVVGVYGVIAYSVSQRTREIGIRMAVGAQTSSVYRLILTEAGWLTVVGIALGLMGSLGAARLMRDLLFGVARGTSQHSCRSRCYWGAQRCLQASFPPAAPPQ